MLINKPKRASPGIEPGPPVPETGILPLNYGAIYDKQKSNIEINREENAIEISQKKKKNKNK